MKETGKYRCHYAINIIVVLHPKEKNIGKTFLSFGCTFV